MQTLPLGIEKQRDNCRQVCVRAMPLEGVLCVCSASFHSQDALPKNQRHQCNTNDRCPPFTHHIVELHEKRTRDPSPQVFILLQVPEEGLEPSRPNGHWILNPVIRYLSDVGVVLPLCWKSLLLPCLGLGQHWLGIVQVLLLHWQYCPLFAPCFGPEAGLTLLS